VPLFIPFQRLWKSSFIFFFSPESRLRFAVFCPSSGFSPLSPYKLILLSPLFILSTAKWTGELHSLPFFRTVRAFFSLDFLSSAPSPKEDWFSLSGLGGPGASLYLFFSFFGELSRSFPFLSSGGSFRQVVFFGFLLGYPTFFILGSGFLNCILLWRANA